MIEIISNEEFLTFKAPLLETNKVLETNRFYPKDIVQEAIDKLIDRIKAKELCGELCSPMPKTPSRHLTVLYKEASHIICDVEWDGDTLIGTMETLNNNCGNIVKNLILNGLPVIFILRSMCETRHHKDGYNIVVEPLHLVTWDCNLDFK